MQTLFALLIGVLTAAGVFLILRRNLLRMVFGLVLLSNAVNLLLLSMGRVVRADPALVLPGATAPAGPYTNPLPQALVLTAIVIGFGLVAFALVLVYRTFVTFGSIETHALDDAARPAPGDPEGGVPSPDPSVPAAPAPEVTARTPRTLAADDPATDPDARASVSHPAPRTR